MTYKTLLTYGSKVAQVEQLYYSPVVVLPAEPNVSLSSIYCLLARPDSWPDDNSPPTPKQDQLYTKNFLKRVFAAKKITSNGISPVIQRIDWTSGITYDYYDDATDMFELDPNGLLIKQFYVKNQYDQVFKCLWNNNQSASTSEPYFQPGTYGTNNIFQGSDGYKWKFMFSVDLGSKVKFMDSSWIPVAVGANTPNPLISNAGYGDIEIINVTNGGFGYDTSNSIINISIVGDGTGASGSAVTSNGSITDIIVTGTGQNYTYANVVISSALGSGAVAISPVSPIGGHAFDPVSELGCSNVMLTAEFNGSESGLIPTDITYHQIGILINPTTNSLNPYPANGAIYKTSTDLVVAPGFGVYTFDETIYQGSSLNDATFTGTMLSFDPASNVVRLINTTGTLVIDGPVFGSNSLTTRTLLSYSTPDFVTLSGYLSYIENRSGIQRSSDGIEQFKIVLGF